MTKLKEKMIIGIVLAITIIALVIAGGELFFGPSKNESNEITTAIKKERLN